MHTGICYLREMKPWLLLFLFFLLQTALSTGQEYTFSGIVTDQVSGDVLPGTTIWIEESQQGTICDSYGFFILQIRQSHITVHFNHLGFQPLDTVLVIQSNLNMKVALLRAEIRIQTAEVKGKPNALELKNTRPGMIRLSAEGIQKMPAMLSEPDPVNSIRYLPGVQSVGEGDGYLYVRGGSADQNLVLLDGGVIYNPAHLFGVFSVINPSVIRSVDLYKSDIPANFGNRLASVVDIHTRAPDLYTTHAELTTGLMLSRFTFETPLVKEKLSLLVAARRSQLDWLARPFIEKTTFKGTGYHFEDLNIRLNWESGHNSRFWATWYSGADRGRLEDQDFGIAAGVGWGNRLLGLNHWYRLSEKNILISSVHLSQYFMNFQFTQHPYLVGVETGMASLSAKTQWQHFHSEKSQWTAGIEVNEKRFNPYRAGIETPGSENQFGYSEPVFSFQASAFAHIQFTPHPRWKIELGSRMPWYLHHGPYTQYEPGIPGQKAIDSTFYASGEPVSTFWFHEGKFNLSFEAGPATTLKAAFSQQSQNVHLVPVSTATLPVDIWTPATSRTPPQTGTNISLGLFQSFKEAEWEAHLEGYYRKMLNQVEFKEGISTLDLLKYNLDMQMTLGQGEAWGLETMIRKKKGRISGWLGYTWSVTTRQFEEINGGKPFYPKYDRRHDLSLVITWQASERLDLNLNYLFATGQAVSLPGSYYYYDGLIVNHYGERNNFRMPPYHRLDFSTRIYPKKKQKIQSTWTFSIYNVYNRMNPFFIYFDTDWINEQGEFGTRARSLSLLPLIPSFSWTGRF